MGKTSTSSSSEPKLTTPNSRQSEQLDDGSGTDSDQEVQQILSDDSLKEIQVKAPAGDEITNIM